MGVHLTNLLQERVTNRTISSFQIGLVPSKYAKSRPRKTKRTQEARFDKRTRIGVIGVKTEDEAIDIKNETDDLHEALDRFLDVSVIETGVEEQTHSEAVDKNTNDPEITKEGSTFPCLECDQTFTEAKLLQKHQR